MFAELDGFVFVVVVGFVLVFGEGLVETVLVCEEVGFLLSPLVLELVVFVFVVAVGFGFITGSILAVESVLLLLLLLGSALAF